MAIRIRKRGKTYSYAFEIGNDPSTGKRRVKEKGGFKSKKEAETEGAKAFAQWKTGNLAITSERVTVREFLLQWLENVARPDLRQSTYQNYASVIKNQIIPIIGSIILQDLRPRDIDSWAKEEARRGLAYRTIKRNKAVLSSALSYAVYPCELLTFNPTNRIKIPKSAPQAKVERRIIPTSEAAALLEEYAMGSKYHMPILLALHTGMRIGEILALEWDAVDFKRGFLAVRQTITNVDRIGLPKTASGSREFPVDRALLAALAEWKSLQERNEKRLGESYQVSYAVGKERKIVELPKCEPPAGKRLDFVCTAPSGSRLHYGAISKILRNRGLNAHSFRHTHATELIAAGATPVDVAARLGHHGIATTIDVYTKDSTSMQEATRALLESRFA